MEVLLERRVHLPLEVGARGELELEVVGQALLVRVVEALEYVGEPADPALAQNESELGVALADAGQDHRGADLVHLERRDHGPRPGRRRALDTLHGVAHRRGAALEDMKRNDKTCVLCGGPQRLPYWMPHRERRAPWNEDGAAQAELGTVTDLVGGRSRVVVRQAAESEETTGLGAIEVGDVVVVGAVDRGEGLVIGDAAVREEPP